MYTEEKPEVSSVAALVRSQHWRQRVVSYDEDGEVLVVMELAGTSMQINGGVWQAREARCNHARLSEPGDA